VVSQRADATDVDSELCHVTWDRGWPSILGNDSGNSVERNGFDMAEVHDMRTRTEQIVLDIGGDIGALILYTKPEANGDEVEISPRGEEGHRSHNQVHERSFNGKMCYAAVYPELHAGEYDLWGEGPTPVDRTTIVGGQVTELDWR
jgi:hypothetical protein